MQDSNYYSRQMSYYEEKIEEAKKEKTNYETLHTILKQLLNGLPDIKSDLIDNVFHQLLKYRYHQQ